MNSQSTAWRQFCKKIVSTVKSAYRRLISNESNRSTDISKIYYYIVMMVSCQHCMWRYSWDVVNVSKWLCWVGFVSCLFVVWDLVYYSLWRQFMITRDLAPVEESFEQCVDSVRLLSEQLSVKRASVWLDYLVELDKRASPWRCTGWKTLRYGTATCSLLVVHCQEWAILRSILDS